MTRRAVLAALGVCLPTAVFGSQMQTAGTVSLKPGDIVMTMRRKAAGVWSCHTFPGNLKTEGEDAPAALRAMADLIETTFTTGGTK